MNVKFVSIIAIVAAFASQPTAIADSPRFPVSWVTASSNGNYLFKMVPNKLKQSGLKQRKLRFGAI